MILKRSAAKEIMDDSDINDNLLDDALGELAFINTYLGGHSTSRKGIQKLLETVPLSGALSVLDVGAGGSDFVDVVSSLVPDVKVTALDFNKRACDYSLRKYPSLAVVHGSVLELPFGERSFDIVHASLFLHHFTEIELHGILTSLCKIARYGIIINDLRRSIVSFVCIRLLTQLFSRSEMVKHDGPLSVRKGFTKSELIKLCSPLPLVSLTIQRMWAFRWLVCIMIR